MFASAEIPNIASKTIDCERALRKPTLAIQPHQHCSDSSKVAAYQYATDGRHRLKQRYDVPLNLLALMTRSTSNNKSQDVPLPP